MLHYSNLRVDDVYRQPADSLWDIQRASPLECIISSLKQISMDYTSVPHLSYLQNNLLPEIAQVIQRILRQT